MAETKQTYDTTTNFKDCIATNLPPRAMRYTMENKCNLSEKGSMYVGLGETRETTVRVKQLNGETIDQTYQIPKTGIITPPTNSGNYQLVCTVDSNGNVTMGWASIGDTAPTIISGITDVNSNNNNNK